MNTVDLPMSQLMEAPWNPNAMDHEMTAHLRESISRFGLVENLVVRPMPDGANQVLSGNQRLQALKDLNFESAPCVVVDLDDANAMLLAQAMNQIQGEDDPGRRAQLTRDVLNSLTEEEVLSVLPETPGSLRDLASLGIADMAGHLSAWSKAQAAKLQHVTFQLTDAQKEVVDEALRSIECAEGDATDNPNKRGNALFTLCETYLKEPNDE